jgi:HEAT repeat protein
MAGLLAGACIPGRASAQPAPPETPRAASPAFDFLFDFEGGQRDIQAAIEAALASAPLAQGLLPVLPSPPDIPPLPPDFDERLNEAVQRAADSARDAMERMRDQSRDVMEKAREARERAGAAREKAQSRAEDAREKALEKVQQKMADGLFAFQSPTPRPMPTPAVKGAPEPPMPPMPPVAFGSGADAMYQQARELIDRERYDQALRRLNDLIERYQPREKPMENRVDAAMYWKAYTLGKEQQFPEALATIGDMQKRYADSRWIKDAKALELELRQSSGQSVSPDAQSDEQLKLLALRGVMRSDPDRAIPMIEQLLSGNSSVNVKENALFVLSQSQTPRAREIIINTAKNNSNPDVQLRAVRYLGIMRNADNTQTLADIYRSTNDTAVKRAIMQGFVASGNPDRLTDIARNEKDVSLRRAAIRSLGAMNAAKTGDVLRQLYSSESSPEVKRDIVDALFGQKNAAALVDLARGEKDAALKRDIVSKLASMRGSKEATDYMLELLK